LELYLLGGAIDRSPPLVSGVTGTAHHQSAVSMTPLITVQRCQLWDNFTFWSDQQLVFLRGWIRIHANGLDLPTQVNGVNDTAHQWSRCH
jgi:hypothetical protein